MTWPENHGRQSRSSPHVSVIAYQGIRRTIMLEFRSVLTLQFGKNPLCQSFAEFDSPLVERVDVPDNTLSEDGMLTKSHQLSQRFRSKTLSENRVRRPVALEYSMRCEPIRRAFGCDLF